MTVFSIYLDDTKGHILINAENKEEALEYFNTSESSPIIEQGIDLENISVDIYKEEHLFTDLKKTFIISYMISDNL